MAKRTQSAAGGAFIALAVLIGAVVGALAGQPTIGVMAGAAIGIVLALLIWLRDRRRVSD